MNPLSQTERWQLLSSYVDGELDPRQMKVVEDLLSSDPEARRDLETLKALKKFVAGKDRLPASLGFWTRVSSEIERRKQEDENLLPFSRRYMPLVASAAAVVIIAAGIILYLQRSTVVDYVSKQSELVQKIVGENILKGSIAPLFSKVDKNQALQFAMFGTLPLDAKAETEFRVNQDSVAGYTFDVDKKGTRKTPKVTVKEFVDEVRPTRIQLEVIDSLLDLASQKLEGSVFVAEDRALAIDPQVSRLNRVTLSGIAATLEPDQRQRFDRFLKTRSAPYTISQGERRPESRERIFRSMAVPARPEPFLVVTPETVMVSHFHMDKDSLRKHFQSYQEGRERVVVNMNGLIRRIAEQRDEMARQSAAMHQPNIRIVDDSEVIRIHIGLDPGDMQMPEMWVKPRMTGSYGVSKRGTSSFRFGGDSSSIYFDFQFNERDIDTMVERMMRGMSPGFEMFTNESRRNEAGRRFDQNKMKRALDSAFIARKGSRSKLDSLMQEMEKKEKRLLQEQQQKARR